MKIEKLFTPVTVGDVTLPNRVFMAPLTRLRSKELGDIPTPLMGEYYNQRAGAGLIITEATQVSFQAKAMPARPVYIRQSNWMRGKKSLRESINMAVISRCSYGT